MSHNLVSTLEAISSLCELLMQEKVVHDLFRYVEQLGRT